MTLSARRTEDALHALVTTIFQRTVERNVNVKPVEGNMIT